MSRQACPQCEKHWTPPGPCDNWYQGETCAYREPGPGRTMRIGSLCSGIGGLERGLERAGLGHTVWHAEIDPHASGVLARHWDVPNLGSVKQSFADAPSVDLICAGYPCQPFSTAGRRQGTDDDRHLWPAVRDAVRDLGPSVVVLENVRGHLSLGFGEVLGDLADLGFDARWGLFRASDVGAPHRRERVFITAWHADRPGLEGRGGLRRAGERPAGPSGLGPAADTAGDKGRECNRDGSAAPDTDGSGEQARRADPLRTGAIRSGRNRRVQPVGSGPDALWGPYGPAIERWAGTLGRPAPAPTVDGRLSPAFVEWMMGFPEGWVDGLSRTAALRCLGNAVVPQVAELVGRQLAPLEAVAA